MFSRQNIIVQKAPAIFWVTNELYLSYYNMDFEAIFFLFYLYRLSSNSRALSLRRQQSTLRKVFMIAKAKRRQLSFFMNTAAVILPLQEANLLRGARRFWSIKRPHLWFESLWRSQELSAVDDYWR